MIEGVDMVLPDMGRCAAVGSCSADEVAELAVEGGVGSAAMVMVGSLVRN